MLTTRATTLLGIEHPVVLGGMGSGTSPELVARVSGAGGLGVLGATGYPPDALQRDAAEIRELTDRPFGLNMLLFLVDDKSFVAMLDARPQVMSFAWPRSDQDLAAHFARSHEIGAIVMHMVSTVAEAERAVAAGADLIVAQGTEGGGHVGLMGTMPLVPMVVSSVDPIPVLAAGGVADGRGLAAALALGADGVLLGTRFLATPEAPIPPSFKHAIVNSDGHDTLVTEVPDVAAGRVWPGAYARVIRNSFVQRWLGREGELRQRQPEVAADLARAHAEDDADNASLLVGQTAGLIDSLVPAADLVRQISSEAEAILRGPLAETLR